MNKDKAIQLLERLQDPEPYEPMLTKDAYDAIQMAIDALSADGDTISRKAAIEVIDSFNVFESRCDQIKLEQMIGELPPTQSEPSQVAKDIARILENEQDMRVIAQPEIIRCKDCKHRWTHKCMDSMPIERCDLGQTFYDAEVDYCSLAERREVTT